MWKRSLLLLLVLLLLSGPLYGDVTLTDEEWMELNLILAELSKRLEQQGTELEFLRIQLGVSLKVIENLRALLEEHEKSLQKLGHEQKGKIILWAVASLLVGGAAGIILE